MGLPQRRTKQRGRALRGSGCPGVLQIMAIRPLWPGDIGIFDPPLTAVRTAYPAPPFLPFFHPPIELARFRQHDLIHFRGISSTTGQPGLRPARQAGGTPALDRRRLTAS